ncbi:NPCBM/NEW2 domain-containing protein [Sphingobium sp. HBC34]|uniref:Alpha-galactosidase n=1 Tax=Sphingobium cyanobacteriorum TaxID=3063954 RepID=A0ABT8ZPD6_9SPHN|nr:NPCBM/NEW2 domain-containing protein [Sphingobium sp. HBC34]MDO7836400.1 NPCBM/NEW2 domain-containing protein [Sphingobium sp. HBC34]
MTLRRALLPLALLCAGTALSAQSPSTQSPPSAQGPDPLTPAGRWSAYQAGQAALPPMGWNSWNAFATEIDEAKLMGSARRIVDSGLAQKGYRYINIDDGWWLQRRTRDGRLMIRADKFPSARTGRGDPSFRPLTDKLHAMGFKAGIYSDLGRNSCSQAYATGPAQLPEGSVAEREVGLYGHIDQDIRLFFADWGFDAIKVDGCGIRAFAADAPRVTSGRFRALAPLIDQSAITRSNIPAVQALFADINQSLRRHNPDGDYLLSLCIWGSANVRAWGKDVGNISRTSDDISSDWSRMLTNYDSAVRRAFYAHPGSWNDPDMLFIGAGDFDVDHLTEARSHFALWAMMNAPLLIGADLRTTPRPLLDIFGNTGLIALNQDPAGHQAILAFDSDSLQILVKTLANGDKAVALFNRGIAPVDAVLTADHLKFLADRSIAITDLWTGTASAFTGEMHMRVEPRQTLVFRATGTRALADGVYLSEQPAIVNPAVDGVVHPQPDPTIYRSIPGWRGTRGIGERPIYAGWGGAMPDATPYDQPLVVGGKGFASGIGVLANSRLEVRNQGFARFTASVGVDDSALDGRQTVRFFLYGDGKPLAGTTPLRRGDAPQSLAADVSGVAIIELVARADSVQGNAVPVTWGDAALRR